MLQLMGSNANPVKIAIALSDKGINEILFVINIEGPGHMIVVYDTIGDTRVACLDNDYKILWDESA